MFLQCKFTGNSLEFSRQILEKTGVTTSGIDFGSGGEGHVIFSYANSLGNIEKGMEILDAFLNGQSCFSGAYAASFQFRSQRTQNWRLLL